MTEKTCITKCGPDGNSPYTVKMTLRTQIVFEYVDPVTGEKQEVVSRMRETAISPDIALCCPHMLVGECDCPKMIENAKLGPDMGKYVGAD